MTTPKKKPARKAREWEIVWLSYSHHWIVANPPPAPTSGERGIIRVREILPPVRKKTTKGKR